MRCHLLGRPDCQYQDPVVGSREGKAEHTAETGGERTNGVAGKIHKGRGTHAHAESARAAGALLL